jgi:dienelactone hydrolase
VPLAGRTAVLVDDGLATGATARAACRVARAAGAARVVVAVPVAPPETVTALHADSDLVLCLETPQQFSAVGQWYRDFTQTTDAEVTRLLQLAAPAPSQVVDLDRRDEEVEVVVGETTLPGTLTVPAGAKGVVVFAHGSGSGRHSPRNRAVAAALNDAGLGTLLLDLLTPHEELERGNVFDVALLARRLSGATAWLRTKPGLETLPVGWFGASTGAAAALWAAAEPDADVAAVVSRGGRPDLAGDRLRLVGVPTLFVVGGHDPAVLELNREAAAQLRFCEHELTVVEGASHLFEEHGALRQVAELAGEWFVRHLAAQPAATG